MLISKSRYLSLFNVFFFSTKYFIIFGKGADQGHRGLARTKDILYSLVYPYLTYCVSVWGSTCQSNLNRIIILLKKIIRIISKVSFDAHTGVLFKKQEIFKFSDIYLYQIGKFMYLFKRGLLPNYFRDMFTLESQIHSSNTRNSSLFYIPHCRTNFRNSQFGFKVLRFSTR